MPSKRALTVSSLFNVIKDEKWDFCRPEMRESHLNVQMGRSVSPICGT